MQFKEERFSLKRMELLMRRDITTGYKNVLIIIAALAAVLITFDVLSFTIFQGSAEIGHHLSTFSTILFIGGFIATSGIFKEVHKRESAQAYLMLPASPLEKTVSRILISNLGWILLTLLWYSAYSYLSAGVTELIAGQHHYLFNPFQTQFWLIVANYLVVQSIFLVGAIYFRKAQLFKTLLTLFAAGVLFSIFMAVLVRIVFAPYFSGMFIIDNAKLIGPMFEDMPFRFQDKIKVLMIIRNVFYWGLLAPVAWLITYIRFREVQVKDAV
ncbi:MAG: hypothetical protein K9L66_04960 [Spirochaetaceae bacterium]|nr:hypothetical protein [Spirochaetaceae bacterium]MCF7948525.1 hypothetical protein [Spirochaetia bacterium]MCF7951003.1 hypothetical protein [Spirochaetaceae bacterium]